MDNVISKFFNLKNRINRARYYLYSIIIVSILSFITELYGGHYIQKFILTLIFFIALLKFVIVTIKRFHDIEMSGSNIIMLIIPIINIYFYYLLLFKKGTTGANQYGEDPL